MKKNRLFDTFAGEFVEIVLGIEVPSSINIQEDHHHELRMPLILNGFLMDIDDQFIYLSNNGEEVDQAFPVNELKHIQVIQLKDAATEMLDMVEAPDDDKSYN